MPLTNKIAADVLLTALDQGNEPAAALELTGKTRDRLSILYTNRALSEIVKTSDDALEGRDLATLIEGEAGVRALAELTVAARGGQALRIELPVKSTRSGETWLAAHLMPAGTASGQMPQRFLLLAKDITADRRAREEQDAMQRMLVSVFVSVDAAVLILDDDGRIIMANPRSSGLLQPAKALGGRLFADVLDSTSQAEFKAAHTAQSDSKASYGLVIKLTTGSGDVLDCNLTAALAQPKNNRRIRILTLQDKRDEAAGGDGSHLFMTGKIRLIGLQDVERLFGDRWPVIREQAFVLADKVIEASLHQADQHFRSEDDGFVVIFADHADRDIETATRTMAERVRDDLLKAFDMPEVARVLSVTTQVRLSRNEAKKPGAVAEALNRSLNGKIADVRREARLFLASATSLARPYVDAIYDSRGRPAGLWQVSVEQETRFKIAEALSALDNQTDEFDINSLSLHFAIDQTIDKAARQGQAFMFPVSIAPLVKKKNAEAYISQCWAIPEPNRQRLIPILTDVPEDVGSPRLLDLYRLIAPLFKAAAIEVRSAATNIGDLTRNPWAVVTIEARNLLREISHDEVSLARMLRIIQTSRAKLMVTNVANDGELARIKTQNIDLYTPSIDFKAQSAAAGTVGARM